MAHGLSVITGVPVQSYSKVEWARNRYEGSGLGGLGLGVVVLWGGRVGRGGVEL